MNSSALSIRSPQSRERSGEVYLRFQLDDKNLAIIAMQQVQEFIVIPAHKVTPIPNLPTCVLGLLNRRSRVMWVLDLAQMLLSQSVATSVEQYNLIIVRVNQGQQLPNKLLGASQEPLLLALMVPQVYRSINFLPEQIQVPQGYFSPSLAPCLQGCVVHQNQMMLVLDAEAIAQSPILQNN